MYQFSNQTGPVLFFPEESALPLISRVVNVPGDKNLRDRTYPETVGVWDFLPSVCSFFTQEINLN